ncbi:XRE family transcriptional regulator [Coprococcus sp. OM04-5BH]|nr:XRE family transcriptional regulator [Coprococcus sp. OM04-5BH]
MCPFLFAENYISRELLSALKRVNGNKFERMDDMNKEIREYDKNVQFEIGQRIQEMRLDKNMKSIELATELGITRNQMSRIENGRANCTIQQLYIMSQIFEHSMDYIISGKRGRQENKITFAQREAIDKMLRAFDK